MALQRDSVHQQMYSVYGIKLFWKEVIRINKSKKSPWEGPLGTPLGLVHWKRASSPVEAGTAGYL